MPNDDEQPKKKPRKKREPKPEPDGIDLQFTPFPASLFGPERPALEAGRLLDIGACQQHTLLAFQMLGQMVAHGSNDSDITRLRDMQLGHCFCQSEHDHYVCCKCGDRHAAPKLEVADILKGWEA